MSLTLLFGLRCPHFVSSVFIFECSISNADDLWTSTALRIPAVPMQRASAKYTKIVRPLTQRHARTLRTNCLVTAELRRGVHPGAGLSRYYRVIQLALESRSEELVEATLPQLQKLIGRSPTPFSARYYSSYSYSCCFVYNR